MKINNIGVMYFSPTNSSKIIANTIVSKIEVKKDIYDITNINNRLYTNNEIKNDLFVLVIPVYAQDIPKLILNFIKNLKGNDTPTIIAITYGNIDKGHTLYKLGKILSSNGFIIIGAGEFISAHSFNHDNLSIASNRPNNEDLNKAKELGQKVIEKLYNYKNIIDCKIKLPKQKKALIAKIVPDNSVNFSTHLPIVNKTCIKCKKCIQVCPNNAINNELEINRGKCLRCFACVRFCVNNGRNIKFRTKFIINTYFKLYGFKNRKSNIWI